MAVSQGLKDHNLSFRTLQDKPIILNDLPCHTQQERMAIRELTVTSYTEDMISLLPRCLCGHRKGAHYATVQTRCEKCGTIVKADVMTEVEANLWFRRPGVFDENTGEFIPMVEKLINPMLLIMLRERFRKSGFNVIDWIIDRNYKTQVKRPPIVTKLEERWPRRGYNFFVGNFREIMDVLFAIKDFADVKDKKYQDLRRLVYECLQKPETIFYDYLPLPNRTLRIVEKNPMGTFVEKGVINAIDTLDIMTSIDKDHWESSPLVKENRTGRAMIMLADYYAQYFHIVVDSRKKGQMRRNIMGGRSPWTARNVITSISGNHNLNETELPWGVGITLFMDHLLGHLLRDDDTLNDAVGLLYGHVNRYNERLDKLLDKLIDDRPDKSFKLMGQRNPSLLQGSALLFDVPRFKKNPRDRTVGLSLLACGFQNADFDGDQKNYTLPVDNFHARKMHPFSIYFNTFGMNKPGGVSGHCQNPKPVVASWSAWLNSNRAVRVDSSDGSMVIDNIVLDEAEEDFEIDDESED